MTQDQITGMLRAIGAMVGGVFIAKGTVSQGVWDWGFGGLLTLGSTAWSLWSNRPAGLAGSTQALPGVNVSTSSIASPAVKAAVKASS